MCVVYDEVRGWRGAALGQYVWMRPSALRPPMLIGAGTVPNNHSDFVRFVG